VRGDPEGPIGWISHEAEAFEEILNSRGDMPGGLLLFWRGKVVTM
jgi:hypothetical protein